MHKTHAVVGKFLKHLSRFGPESISPAQVAAAVVSAARCGVQAHILNSTLHSA